MTVPKKRSRGELARERIIEAAIDVFSKNGWEKGSLQRIADRSDMSQTALLHHFPSKDNLLVSVIEEIVARNHDLVSRMAAPEDTAYDRLVHYGVGNATWAVKAPNEMQVIILLYHLSTFDPDFSAIYREIRSGAQARIREYLLAGKRERVFSFEGDAAELSEILHESLMGSVINILSHVPRQDAKRALATLKRKWLKAISDLCKPDRR
jgi:AcrR family transcriptional regulator